MTMPSLTSLKKYDFTFQIGERTFTINEQTTIQELDEAVKALNTAIGTVKDREQSFKKARQRLAEFMRQHHAFDLYIEVNKPRGESMP